MRKYLQGTFTPKNPSKYSGDVTKIFFRSSWERKIMLWLDDNPSIIKWNSEETVIPYISPIDGKVHRYFTDFSVLIKDKHGALKRYIIEVKPKAQTMPPKVPKRQSKSYIDAVQTYMVNESKWKAAREWCSKNNFEFMILTEENLYKK